MIPDIPVDVRIDLPPCGTWPKSVHPFDLQWEYDAVARLGKAQVLATVKSDLGHRDRLDPRCYLIPGPLWWVFNWQSAATQIKDHSQCKANPSAKPGDWTPDEGAV